MITRRSTGGLQPSPITVGINGDGKAVISRETAYKVRTAATLCIFTNNFLRPLDPDRKVPQRLCPSRKPWMD
jgi:hypothetical protein